MLYRILLVASLLIPLSGCAVYGYGDDRGYRDHHYYNGYRRDYSSPVYVTPRYYYDDRRRQYHAPPRYAPAPQPRHRYSYEQRYRGDYKGHQQPRHDKHHDVHREAKRGVKMQQRSWDAGRSTQQRYSNGRSYNDQRRSNQRRW